MFLIVSMPGPILHINLLENIPGVLKLVEKNGFLFIKGRVHLILLFVLCFVPFLREKVKMKKSVVKSTYQSTKYLFFNKYI